MEKPTPTQVSAGTMSDDEWEGERGKKVPVHIEHLRGKHVVKDNDGRVYGRHETHEQAMAQMSAINNSMHKKKTGKGFIPPGKGK